MGTVDQFLQAHAQAGLLPGERVLGMGLLRRPLTFTRMGVPSRYASHLGVATDRRLVLFETEVGGLLSAVAKPVAGRAIVWRFDELAEVRLHPVEGLVVHSGGQATAMTLVPHPGTGPLADEGRGEAPVVSVRLDIYAAAENLDAQRDFFAQFPGWLQRQVAAGAFPPDPAQVAAVQARIAARRVRVASEAAAHAEREKAKQATTKKVVLVLGCGVLLAALFFALLVAIGLSS